MKTTFITWEEYYKEYAPLNEFDHQAKRPEFCGCKIEYVYANEHICNLSLWTNETDSWSEIYVEEIFNKDYEDVLNKFQDLMNCLGLPEMSTMEIAKSYIEMMVNTLNGMCYYAGKKGELAISIR